MVWRIIFINVVRAMCNLNQRLLIEFIHAIVNSCDTGTYAENHVSLVDEMNNHICCCTTPGPEGQFVCFR